MTLRSKLAVVLASVGAFFVMAQGWALAQVTTMNDAVGDAASDINDDVIATFILVAPYIAGIFGGFLVLKAALKLYRRVTG